MKKKSIYKQNFEKTITDIYKFENSVNLAYKEVNEKDNKKVYEYFGYLMDSFTYDILKTKISYDQLNNKVSKENLNAKINEKFKYAQVINFHSCEQKIFHNIKEMKKDLRSGNEYIIVDYNIGTLLSNKKLNEKEGKYKYEINSKNLSIFLNDKEKISFKHDFNRITYKNLLKSTEKEEENINNNEGSKEKDNNKPITILKKKVISSQIKKEENRQDDPYKIYIKILLEIILFSQEFQKQIFESAHSNNDPSYLTECYLIKENWFTDNINYGFYYKLYQYFLNKKRKYELEKQSKEFIVEDLYKEYKSQLKGNNIKLISLLNDPKQLKVEYKSNYDDTEMIFDNKYIIINKDIFNSIIDINLKQNLIKELKLFISKKTVIIQQEDDNSIFIGNISKYNIFVPKLIIKYNDKEEMKKQYDNIEDFGYSFFEKDLNINKDKKINDLIDKKSKNKIGDIYTIDKNKYDKLNEFIENILTNLYYNDEELKVMNNEKYYMINNKYIKKLKELSKFDEYFKLIQGNNKKDINNLEKDINKIINQNKQIIEINKNQIKYELGKKEYIHLIKENLKENNIFYYTEFEIVSEKLKECLIDYDLFSKSFELVEINCRIKNNKIIISPNFKDKFFALICTKDNKNEYITEIVLNFNDKKNWDNFIKGKISPKLSFKDKKCEIYDDEGNSCGTSYELIETDKNEILEEIKVKNDILNMIKIYLYNKDLINKISLSKTEKGDDKIKYKEYISSEKCFLINKEQMDLYKEYYLYNELKNEINKYMDKNDKIQKDPKGNIFSYENLLNIYEFLNKNNFFQKYQDKDIYKTNEKMFEIKKTKVPNEEDISYNNVTVEQNSQSISLKSSNIFYSQELSMKGFR